MLVIINYPGLGTKSESFSFPNDDLLEMLCGVPNQGWPKWFYYISRIASVFGWPHHNTVAWVQELGKEETLRLFLLHRVVDLLGALSLLCRDGLLSARVVSQCSGHEADLQTILQADKLICRLE